MSKRKMSTRTKYSLIVSAIVLLIVGVLVVNGLRKSHIWADVLQSGQLENQGTLTYTDSQNQGKTVDSNKIQLTLSTAPQGPIWDRTPCGFNPDGTFDTEYKCFLPIKVTGNGAVELNWNPATASGPSAYPLAYEIKYKKTSEGSWTTVTQPQTKFTKTGLSPSDTYEFQITALDFQGNRSTSTLYNQINLGSSDTQVPTWLESTQNTYSGFYANPSNDNYTAKLNWEGATDNTKIFTFMVEYQKDGQSEWKTRVVPVDLANQPPYGSHGAGARLDLTGLEPGTNKFKLMALDEAGHYTYLRNNTSPTVATADVKGTAGGDTTAPVFPDMDWNQGKVALTWDSGADKYKLSWPAATDNTGIDHYTYRIDDAVKIVNTLVAQGTTTATSANINSGIIAGNKYLAWVVAYDAAGNYVSLGDQMTAPASGSRPSGVAPNEDESLETITGIANEPENPVVPIANSPLVIKDNKGNTIAETTTDQNGQYSFKINPQDEQFTVESQGKTVASSAETTTVTGTLTDTSSSHAVIADSDVALKNNQNTIVQTKTNQDGKYTFKVNLPSGKYQVEASKDGYKQATHDASLNEGQITTVDMQMKKRSKIVTWFIHLWQRITGKKQLNKVKIN